MNSKKISSITSKLTSSHSKCNGLSVLATLCLLLSEISYAEEISVSRGGYGPGGSGALGPMQQSTEYSGIPTYIAGPAEYGGGSVPLAEYSSGGGGGYGGEGGGGGYGSYGGYGPSINAAVYSQNKLSVIPVAANYEQPKVHSISVDAAESPLILTLKSKSSPLIVNAVHEGSGKGSMKKTHSVDEPHIRVHETFKPVIHEVREIVAPKRQINQFISPVQQNIKTLISSAKEGGYGGGGYEGESHGGGYGGRGGGGGYEAGGYGGGGHGRMDYGGYVSASDYGHGLKIGSGTGYDGAYMGPGHYGGGRGYGVPAYGGGGHGYSDKNLVGYESDTDKGIVFDRFHKGNPKMKNFYKQTGSRLRKTKTY